MKLGKRLVLSMVGGAFVAGMLSLLVFGQLQAQAATEYEYRFKLTSYSSNAPSCACDTSTGGNECTNPTLSASEDSPDKCSDQYVTRGKTYYKIYEKAEKGRAIQALVPGRSSAGHFCINNYCVEDWSKLTQATTGKGKACINGYCVLSVPKEPKIIADLAVDGASYSYVGNYLAGQEYTLSWNIADATKIELKQDTTIWDVTNLTSKSFRIQPPEAGSTLRYQLIIYSGSNWLTSRTVEIYTNSMPSVADINIYPNEYKSLDFYAFGAASIELHYTSSSNKDSSNALYSFGCTTFNGTCGDVSQDWSSKHAFYQVPAPRKYTIIVRNKYGAFNSYNIIMTRNDEYGTDYSLTFSDALKRGEGSCNPSWHVRDWCGAMNPFGDTDISCVDVYESDKRLWGLGCSENADKSSDTMCNGGLARYVACYNNYNPK